METKSKCPTCGQKANIDSSLVQRKRELIGTRLELTDFARQGALLRDSCILCVKKHIATAKAYYREMLKAKDSGDDTGTGNINVMRNYIDVIGELILASEEAMKWQELADTIILNERHFRYYMNEPKWDDILQMIIDIEKTT